MERNLNTLISKLHKIPLTLFITYVYTFQAQEKKRKEIKSHDAVTSYVTNLLQWKMKIEIQFQNI